MAVYICTYALPVKIEDGVWIGGGAILLPGVISGRNSVIGAGSVVTRSIPANCVAVGNPCRVIKQIESDDIILAKYYNVDMNYICGLTKEKRPFPKK